MSETRGHLFIINGDLNSLKCDAVLVPTDEEVNLTPSFALLMATTARQTFSRDLRVTGWGQRSTVKVATNDPGPDVWLGNIGGTIDTPVGHFRDGATNFVEVALKDLRPRWTHRRPPILALPVVGSGHGGGSSRCGDILSKLVPELMRLALSEGCDIVLVTYGRPTFDAAQTVRRKAIQGTLPEQPPMHDPWQGLSTDRRKAADDLALHARRGDLVVFVGAGVSASAGLPAWKGLLRDVATRLGLDEPGVRELQELDVRDQATLLSEHGEKFRTAVKQALSSERYSLTHGLLVSLPVREFVTTNFDTLLEVASTSPGNKLTVVPGEPVRSSSRMLVKLHGTLGKDLVLTRSEYRDVKSRHGALFGLLQAYMITKHMLFVGYSMQDEDFNDVMHDVRELRKASAPGKGPKPGSSPNSSRFGTVLTDFANSQFAELWGDLEVLPALPSRHAGGEPTGSPTDEDWARVSREHAIFLDRVGMMSASVGFATDPTFSAVEVAGAPALREIAMSLRRLYEDHGGDDGELWRDVRLFLDAFNLGDS